MPTAQELAALRDWKGAYYARIQGGRTLYESVRLSRSGATAELTRTVDGSRVTSFTDLETKMVLVRKPPQRLGMSGYLWDKGG